MSDLDKLAIGVRIRSIRADMTQKDFADRLGVGRTSVVRYEGGERTPDAEFIAKAYAVFGIDPIWLLTGVGAGTPSLTREESALLDNFRHSPPEAQKAIKTTSDLLAQRHHPDGDAECG